VTTVLLHAGHGRREGTGAIREPYGPFEWKAGKVKRAFWLLALVPLLLTGCILPPGLQVIVSTDGCTSNGECWHGGASPSNYYDAPSRAVVLYPDQPVQIVAHELCHAHQHAMVLAKDPASNDLMAYFGTSEGMAFLALRNQAPSVDALEDAAWVCAWYYVDPDRLYPNALAWAQEWLK
jgi:hypothetical protein